MNGRLTELQIVQNPALGCYTIWKFGLSFQREAAQIPSFLLVFLVLPLVLHRPTLDLINSTRRASGLGIFAAKLAEERENLIAVHERARSLRVLTLQSVMAGADARLFTIQYELGLIRANRLDAGVQEPKVPDRLRDIVSASDKLGVWFSKSDLQQISLTLAVEF